MKLWLIVCAQFCGTSLWFAGNAIMPALLADVPRIGSGTGGSTALFTSAVQLGFIAGTLFFSVLALADRYSPAKLFFLCSLLGASLNAFIPVLAGGPLSLGLLRLATGFCLAGIYPVGMKLAARWYPTRAGQAIGYLVGALVLGTAFPHLVSTGQGDWRMVLWIVSGLALLGGVLVLWGVGDPPGEVKAAVFRVRDLGSVFASPQLRRAACGYFGHMWELYAFWAAVPALLVLAIETRGAGEAAYDASLLAFFVIGAGAIGCVVGGLFSRRHGSAIVAFVQLSGSGLLCLLAPLIFGLDLVLILALLFLWGVLVAGDSPQFSAMAARTAPAAHVGTALTAVTGIGFALTIPSIQLLAYLIDRGDPGWALLALAPGPALGLWALWPLLGARDQDGRRL